MEVPTNLHPVQWSNLLLLMWKEEKSSHLRCIF